ncbi:MAG: hypothetical protein RL754_996 [Bacteroidota bacterium]|jgi:membrane protein YqaA with SNARE-associated domain
MSPKRIARIFILYHRLYRLTGAYAFMRENLFNLLISIGLILGGIFAFDTFVVDIDVAVAWLTKHLSAPGLLGIFFLSEVSIGLITPEILILWAEETLKPKWMLLFLATLSYGAGITSYFIGRFWSTRKIIRERLLERNAKTMDQLRRFGALLIILAALTPLPYPIICQLSGLNKFPFRIFAWITLVRFLRFVIYGALLYKLF